MAIKHFIKCGHFWELLRSPEAAGRQWKFILHGCPMTVPTTTSHPAPHWTQQGPGEFWEPKKSLFSDHTQSLTLTHSTSHEVCIL